MADFTKQTVADMVIGDANLNVGTTGSMQVVDWGTEEGHWQENHPRQPWATKDKSYDDYKPAYKYGYDARVAHEGKPWDAVSGDLERGWDAAKGESKAGWHEVKDAVHGAYTRIKR